MGTLLLINPRGHGKVKKSAFGTKKRKTAKPRGKPKMAKKRRKAARRTKSKSQVRVVRAVRSTTRGKPRTARGRKRAAKAKRLHVKGYYPNPIRKARRVKRRRNPIGGLPSLNHIKNNLVMPALTGAAGAIALDVAWANLPIPANMKTGYIGDAVKLVGAVALSTLAAKVVSKQAAENMGVGMITVQAYNMGRKLIAANLPGLKMGGMGWVEAGYPVNDMGEYVSGMGEYVSGDDPLMLDAGDGDYMDMDTIEEYDYSGV